MKTSFKFYPGRLKNNGLVPIYLQVTINREKKRFNLDIDSFPSNIIFKKDPPQIKRSDSEYLHKNQIIDKAYQKALRIRQEYSYRGYLLTIAEFTRCFDNVAFGTESFYTYAEEKKKQIQNIRAEATIQFYYKQISKLKAFRPELRFSDITMDFMEKYQAHMIQELRNKENTWNKSLEFVKRIMNKAFDEDLLQFNPIKRQKIKRVKGTGEHLTTDEVNKLEDLNYREDLKHHLRPVLQYFLFACYTGLRYRDVKEIRFNNLKLINGNKWLIFVQHKTGKITKIPLIAQALNLLPEEGFSSQHIFKVLTNQPTNRYLKDIITLASIKKNITFHSARHTCSNLLLSAGVPLEVRCMIIGDTREVITSHYTSEDENLKIMYMSRFSESLEALNH